MAIIIGKNGIQISVTSFKDALSNGITVCELEKIIAKIDPNNPDATAKEIERCNNRCNGNDVDAVIKTTKTTSGGEQTQEIKFKGKINP